MAALEEKKTNELTDEALECASGGGDGGIVIMTCPFCGRGRIPFPASGPWAESCPCCEATLYCVNGVLEFCSPGRQPETPERDMDDNWL